jgi:hypothetical protein
MNYTMSSTRIFPSASTKTEKLAYAVVTRIEMSWSNIPVFRKVADKLFDAFLPNSVRKIFTPLFSAYLQRYG